MVANPNFSLGRFTRMPYVSQPLQKVASNFTPEGQAWNDGVKKESFYIQEFRDRLYLACCEMVYLLHKPGTITTINRD